jgi:hypothetical protein
MRLPALSATLGKERSQSISRCLPTANISVCHTKCWSSHTATPVKTDVWACERLEVSSSQNSLALYNARWSNIQQFYVLPTQCIYVFCVDLRTNSDYFPIQH